MNHEDYCGEDGYYNIVFPCCKHIGHFSYCDNNSTHFYLAIQPGDLDISSFCDEHNYPAAGVEVSYHHACDVKVFLDKINGAGHGN